MSDELLCVIALAVAGVVSRTVYTRIMNGGTKNRRFIEKAKANGHYTTGEYEDSQVLLGNDNSKNAHMRNKSLQVRYRYQVNGTTYCKHMTFQSPGKVSVDFPVSTTVYYDPKNPKKAVCPEEATKSQQLESGCLSSIGIFILTLFVTFHILRFFLG